jgi:hypothetical protein
MKDAGISSDAIMDNSCFHERWRCCSLPRFPPAINSNFTLRAAHNTAARVKGTIFHHASRLLAPHNQPLPTAGKRPVPVADSISSAVTLTAGLIFRQFTLVEIIVHFKRSSQ